LGVLELERVRDSYEFPTDLAEDSDPRGALRWTAGVIAMTAGLLALTNAQSISGWAAEFEPGPGTTELARAADGWEEITASVGLGYGHARLHKVWKRVEQARWSGNGAVVEQASVAGGGTGEP
jgi:hypothetical protein